MRREPVNESKKPFLANEKLFGQCTTTDVSFSQISELQSALKLAQDEELDSKIELRELQLQNEELEREVRNLKEEKKQAKSHLQEITTLKFKNEQLAEELA
jgi:chromosome segregation ATPase